MEFVTLVTKKLYFYWSTKKDERIKGFVWYQKRIWSVIFVLIKIFIESVENLFLQLNRFRMMKEKKKLLKSADIV